MIKIKSYEFALDIIQACQILRDKEHEYVLSKQLLRAGTSIGANIEEALAASSKKDFIHRMSIASREARETVYWLRLLGDSRLLKDDNSILIDKATELVRLLTAIVKTSSMSDEKYKELWNSSYLN